ncbi:MAG: branched-chain amino acid ABC transporter permease [Peptococcia bacterium]
MTIDVFVNLAVAGLSTGMMYYLVAAGLTLVFGLMGVLNFAHGTVFMIGAYAGCLTFQYTMNFPLAIIVAIIVGGIVGLVMERGLLRNHYGNHMTQILLTTGIMTILTELIQIPFGPLAKVAYQPLSLTSSWVIGDITLIKYRVFVIVIGALIAAGINLAMAKSKVGMTVRAGVQDSDMVMAMGINIKQTFLLVFIVGSALAAMGGFLMSTAVGAYSPYIGLQYQMFGFMVVVIGGLGSFSGTVLASVLIGLSEAFVAFYAPAFSNAVPVLIMIIVLLIKPSGLFGKKVV